MTIDVVQSKVLAFDKIEDTLPVASVDVVMDAGVSEGNVLVAMLRVLGYGTGFDDLDYDGWDAVSFTGYPGIKMGIRPLLAGDDGETTFNFTHGETLYLDTLGAMLVLVELSGLTDLTYEDEGSGADLNPGPEIVSVSGMGDENLVVFFAYPSGGVNNDITCVELADPSGWTECANRTVDDSGTGYGMYVSVKPVSGPFDLDVTYQTIGGACGGGYETGWLFTFMASTNDPFWVNLTTNLDQVCS